MSELKRLSKTLSYWLRHRPDEAGLALDGEGWAEVTAVLASLAAKGLPGDRGTLDRVLAEGSAHIGLPGCSQRHADRIK